ncbi:MAG TPA: hypothetical protein VD908_01610 [Cytophagales bacterium]|nr:hypothetical protein [Cytophagales bacterium]
MKNQTVYFLAITVLFAFCSCKSTAILRASFESDAVDSPPATNLQGEPSGDVIQFNPALQPMLVVKNSTTAGEKALHFVNSPLSGDISPSDKWVSFKGINTNLAETIWFTFTASNVSPNGNVLIDVTDGHAHIIARMRIKPDGELGLASDVLDDYTDVIGNVGTGNHTIVFTCMFSDLKYNVTVFKSSGNITATDKPMIVTNPLHFSNPANPMLSFRHSGATSTNHKYVVENILISRKKPDM